MPCEIEEEEIQIVKTEVEEEEEVDHHHPFPVHFSLQDYCHHQPQPSRKGNQGGSSAFASSPVVQSAREFGEEIENKVRKVLKECIGVLERDPRGYHPFYLTVHDCVKDGLSRGFISEEDVDQVWERIDEAAVASYNLFLEGKVVGNWEGGGGGSDDDQEGHSKYVKYILRGKQQTNDKPDNKLACSLRAAKRATDKVLAEIRTSSSSCGTDLITDLKSRLQIFEIYQGFREPEEVVQVNAVWTQVLQPKVVARNKKKGEGSGSKATPQEKKEGVKKKAERKPRREHLKVAQLSPEELAIYKKMRREDRAKEMALKRKGTEGNEGDEGGGEGGGEGGVADEEMEDLDDDHEISRADRKRLNMRLKRAHSTPEQRAAEASRKRELRRARGVELREVETSRRRERRRELMTQDKRAALNARQLERRRAQMTAGPDGGEINEHVVKILEKRRLMTPERKQAIAEYKRAWAKANYQRLKAKSWALLSQEQKDARVQRAFMWRHNMPTAKREAFRKKLNDGMKKYHEKVRQDPQKWAAQKERLKFYYAVKYSTLTPEQRQKRLATYRINQARRKIRKEMEAQGCTEEEFQKRMEQVAKEITEKVLSAPPSEYKPRPRKNPTEWKPRPRASKEWKGKKPRENASTSEQLDLVQNQELPAESNGEYMLEEQADDDENCFQDQDSPANEPDVDEPQPDSPEGTSSHFDDDDDCRSHEEDDGTNELENDSPNERTPAPPSSSSAPILEEGECKHVLVAAAPPLEPHPAQEEHAENDTPSVAAEKRPRRPPPLIPLETSTSPCPSTTVELSIPTEQQATCVVAKPAQNEDSCAVVPSSPPSVADEASKDSADDDPTSNDDDDEIGVDEKNDVEASPCDECGTLIKPKHMSKHKFWKHNPTFKGKTCPQCPRVFIKEAHLWRHFSAVHIEGKSPRGGPPRPRRPNQNDTTAEPRPGSKPQPSTSTPEPKICPFCAKSFSTLQILTRHEVTVHGNRNEPGVNSFTCEYCSKEYKQKAILLDHVRRVHRGEGQHFCDLCPKGRGDLQSAVKLWKHKVDKHGLTDLPPPVSVEKCEFCGEAIARGYEAHVRRVHPDMFEEWRQRSRPVIVGAAKSRQYRSDYYQKRGSEKCPECSKEVKRYGMSRHMRLVHGVGLRLYKCPQCSLEYKTLDRLRNHVRQKHDPLDEILHRLKLTEYEMDVNNRISSGSCLLCSERFTEKLQVRTHFASAHPAQFESARAEYDALVSNPEEGIRREGNALEWNYVRERGVYTVGGGMRDADTSCEKCESKFSTLAELGEHVKVDHPESYLPCPYCHIMKYSKSRLRDHVYRTCRRKHTSTTTTSNETKKEDDEAPRIMPLGKAGRKNTKNLGTTSKCKTSSGRGGGGGGVTAAVRRSSRPRRLKRNVCEDDTDSEGDDDEEEEEDDSDTGSSKQVPKCSSRLPPQSRRHANASAATTNVKVKVELRPLVILVERLSEDKIREFCTRRSRTH